MNRHRRGAPLTSPLTAPMAARRGCVAAALSLPLWAAAQPARRLLQPMTEGPFYPPPSWRAARDDWDADLTRVDTGAGTRTARGEHLGLALRVVDRQGRPIDRAEVEIWQCDVLAAYRHPSVDATPERLDPGFQGFGAARGDAAGQVNFRTIRPVPYPGRTPHIHVKVRHPTFGAVTSQLFVDGDPGNARDFLWRQLDADDRRALAMRLQPAADDGLRWRVQHDLVLPG